MRLRRALVAVAVAGVALAPAARAETGEAPREDVAGLATATPCVPVVPDGYDPATGRSDCRGSAATTGSWLGVARYHAIGRVDPVTGNAAGRINQRWEGTGHSAGCGLFLTGTFTVDGFTGMGVSRMRIVEATGSCAGAKGEVTYSLYQPLTGGVQTGTYAGTWTAPQQR